MPASSRRVLVAAVLAALGCGLAPPVLADGLGGRAGEYHGLSADAMGKHPLLEPDYQGVAQLLVLSDRWVIVVFNDMQRLYNEVDRLSGGELQGHVDTWLASEEAGRPNWPAYHGRFKTRDRFIAEARTNIGERAYSKADTYTIRSDTDPAYASDQKPARATRLLVSQGNARETHGVFPIDFSQYVYLELPEPMQPGQRYTIRHADGRQVGFRYDLRGTVSRAIKVNQLGYLDDGPEKIAYLGAHLYDFGPLELGHIKRFDVVNAQSGEVVHTGAPKLRAEDPSWEPLKPGQDWKGRPTMYGEHVYELTFGEVTEPGWYFLSVPGVGRSWPFRVGPDVYGELLFTAMRGFYHQRCTIELREPYTAWPRQKTQDWSVYENDMVWLPMHEPERPKNFNWFDIIGATTDKSRSTYPVPGGWHDAADWDRGNDHFVVIFDLLSAYEHRPGAFKDNQLNLPESGNGIPDVLDEVVFGLKVWTASMDERGGVSGIVETWTHPTIDDERFPYSFSRRTRWSSLIYAAAAAQLSRAIRPYDADEAERYLKLAKKAYAFGIDPANALGEVTMNAKTKRGQGEPYTVTFVEREEHTWPYRLHANAQLYLTTKDKTYLNDLGEWAFKAHAPMRWRFNLNDFSPWIYASVVQCGDAAPAKLVEHCKNYLLAEADKRVGYTHAMPYRIAWPKNLPAHMAWGNSHGTNLSRVMWIAYMMTGEAKYREAAILNVDAMLGANAHGMSWVTGVGYTYPVDIQHAPSIDDRITDPVPGITVYGITGGPIYAWFRKHVWESPGGDGQPPVDFTTPAQRKVPLWRRFMVHPSLNVPMNEFTVATSQSGMALSAAMLTPENGWAPDENLIHRKPRQEALLFGHWYLP